MVAADGFGPKRVATLSKGAVAFVTGVDRKCFESVEEAVGFPLVRPYRLSEANSQVFVGDPDAPIEERLRVGGPPIDLEEERACVVDPVTGDPFPACEEGELCLRGYNFIGGYLERPEATAAVIDNEWWFHRVTSWSADPEAPSTTTYVWTMPSVSGVSWSRHGPLNEPLPPIPRLRKHRSLGRLTLDTARFRSRSSRVQTPTRLQSGRSLRTGSRTTSSPSGCSLWALSRGPTAPTGRRYENTIFGSGSRRCSRGEQSIGCTCGWPRL